MEFNSGFKGLISEKHEEVIVHFIFYLYTPPPLLTYSSITITRQQILKRHYLKSALKLSNKQKNSILHQLPMKMGQTECSETSAYKIQTPGNYPKECIKHSEHSESLKSRKKIAVSNTAGWLFLAASWRKYLNVGTGSCQLMEYGTVISH